MFYWLILKSKYEERVLHTQVCFVTKAYFKDHKRVQYQDFKYIHIHVSKSEEGEELLHGH